MGRPADRCARFQAQFRRRLMCINARLGVRRLMGATPQMPEDDMSYATVLVYVDTEQSAEAPVRIAAALAEKFNATLIGLSALGVRPAFAAEGVVIDERLSPALVHELKEELSETEAWFRRIAGGGQRRPEWRSAVDIPIDVLAREARCADLIVVPRDQARGDVYNSIETSSAVLKLGRPALVLPPNGAALEARHIVIGWKDTREARRAVQDALPFLHEAERVTIVEICETGEEADASGRLEDVACYLGRHRIKASPRIILHRQGPAASQLLMLAASEGADLLVTGAYEHSRLGEWIFGGVTQNLLARSALACLMSH
jgi:nucleotide-binding universal stress UspA family protein